MTTHMALDGAMSTSSSERLLKVKEASDILCVHPNTVRVWSEGGLLPTYRIGPRRDRRFRLADVEALLRIPLKEQGTSPSKMAKSRIS